MGLVRAVGGNTAWTCGLTLDDISPPSGPSNAVSCLTRVTIAKYLGKSDVRMRVIRRWYNSSAVSKSALWNSNRYRFGFLLVKYWQTKKNKHATCNMQHSVENGNNRWHAKLINTT